MSADAEKDLFIVLTALWGLSLGYVWLIGFRAFFWPEYFDLKYLHKYIHDKRYINDTIAFTMGVTIYLLSFVPGATTTRIYPAGKFGAEYRDDIVLTVYIAAGVGLVLVGLWQYWLSGTGDPIQKVLDKHEEDLPVLVEIHGSESELSPREYSPLERVLKNKEVKRLRYKFYKVSWGHKNPDYVLKKYQLEGQKRPFVCFINKDRSKETVEGREIFHEEDILHPEKYTALLRKVLEQYGRPF